MKARLILGYYMQHHVKTALLLGLLPFTLSSCTTVPTQKHESQPKSIPTTKRPQRIILPSPSQQKPQVPSRTINESPPKNYQAWLTRHENQLRTQQYENFLQRQHVYDVVPTYQLLRSARDWERCGAEPYAVPSSDLWQNLIPTLHVLQKLVQQEVLSDFEVTSVYRDSVLNQCAGGAAQSRHVQNSALDFRIGPEQITTAAQIRMLSISKSRLCDFWREYGASYNLGLGVYASGQIHIDTQGYRTWGPDHTSATSICTTESE